MDFPEKIAVFGEIKDKIQTTQLVINSGVFPCWRNGGGNRRWVVEITPDTIVLSSSSSSSVLMKKTSNGGDDLSTVTTNGDAGDVDSSSTVIIRLPDDVKLPLQCTRIRWIPGEGIEMMLRLRTLSLDHIKTKKRHGGGVGEGGGGGSCWDFLVNPVMCDIRYLKQPDARLICRNCKAKLNKKSFKRVLELPSEDWRDGVDNWLCHPNKTTKDIKSRVLSPHPGDCLASDIYYLLHPDVLYTNMLVLDPTHDDRVMERPDNTSPISSTVVHVCCKRCLSLLGYGHTSKGNLTGVEDAEYFKMYKCSVAAQCSSSLGVKSGDVVENFEELMSSYFSYQVNSNSAHRFLLFADDPQRPGDIVALIWVLNTNGRILYNSTSVDENANKPSEKERTINTVSHPIMRVLYKECLEINDLVKVWLKDITVHNLALPYKLCLKLLQILIRHTGRLPESVQSVDEFRAAMLPVY